ncbi:hypothetical protein [Aquibacillus salsiterrae]|uniref:Lipoprotein n=1 Tax=Aquibacillus salsiterrae TaxID=2950439 RepID=A0A9X3WJC0_9BACI|nr:hypothetical protein [Aquibacillus salsiterrae]MDC3418414.1 hypothetical protein [Aquibacillus salsiterrae]
MRKFLLVVVLFFLVAGCSKVEDDVATISANRDSDYVNTFNDLSLGILFDFNFYLPDADGRWVNLWVEKYQDGKMEAKTIAQLSYGNSPSAVEEGHLGFGMINQNDDETSVFLYGPGVSMRPTLEEALLLENAMSTWDYALPEDEKVELKLNKPTILAGYRQTNGNSMRTYAFNDETSAEKMITEDDLVLLLKIKIEEEPPRE